MAVGVSICYASAFCKRLNEARKLRKSHQIGSRSAYRWSKTSSKHPGDIYREIKVGAVFEAKPGRDRSELPPGILVDGPVAGSLHYVAQCTALDDFVRRLYILADQAACEVPSESRSWETERSDYGDWWLNTFLTPCKSSMSDVRKSV